MSIERASWPTQSPTPAALSNRANSRLGESTPPADRRLAQGTFRSHPGFAGRNMDGRGCRVVWRKNKGDIVNYSKKRQQCTMPPFVFPPPLCFPECSSFGSIAPRNRSSVEKRSYPMNDPKQPDATQPMRRRRRPKRLRAPRPEIMTLDQILAWADAFHAEHGRWPNYTRDCHVKGTISETWRNLDMALRRGNRGLLGGSSLACLLAERRGRRNPAQLPPWSVEQILDWADAFQQKKWGHPTFQAIRLHRAAGSDRATTGAAAC